MSQFGLFFYKYEDYLKDLLKTEYCQLISTNYNRAFPFGSGCPFYLFFFKEKKKRMPLPSLTQPLVLYN